MRIPVLFYTYLATEILAPFFASFVILSSVLFLGRLIPFLDLILGLGIGLGDFCRLSANLLPQLFFFSIPMAGMMAVIISFSRLTNDREIMAFKAGGIGVYRMLVPVVVIAFCTAGLSALFAMRLAPAGHVAMKSLLVKLAKEKVDKGLREKRFSEGTGDVVMYVDRLDQKSRDWQGVYVSDMRNREVPVTIMARSGSLAAGIEEAVLVLVLVDGSLHRVIDDLDQTIRFDRYTLNLPLHQPAEGYADGAAGQPGKHGMTQRQLWRQAAIYGTDTAQGRALLIEYHNRLVLPVGCFILILLGFPLGLWAAPGRRAVGIPLGLCFFVLYYVLDTAAKAICESSALPVAPVMWLPNVVFGVLAGYLIHATAMETLAGHFSRLRFAGLLSRRRPRQEGS